MPETTDPSADLASVSRVIEEVVRGARIPWRRGREELRAELWSHFEDSGREAGGLGGALARLGDPAALAQGFRHVYARDYRLFYLGKLAASLIASALMAVAVQLAANLRLGTGAALWRLAPAFPKALLISVAVVLGAVGAWESLRRPAGAPQMRTTRAPSRGADTSGGSVGAPQMTTTRAPSRGADTSYGSFSPRRGLLAGALYLLASLAVEVAFGRGIAAFMAGLVIVALGYATSRLRNRSARLGAAYLAFSIFVYGAHRVAAAGAMPLLPALATSASLLAVWAASLAILARFDRAFRGLVGQS